MAKIGNEAKLILKLAKERAEKRLADLTSTRRSLIKPIILALNERITIG